MCRLCKDVAGHRLGRGGREQRRRSLQPRVWVGRDGSGSKVDAMVLRFVELQGRVQSLARRRLPVLTVMEADDAAEGSVGLLVPPQVGLDVLVPGRRRSRDTASRTSSKCTSTIIDQVHPTSTSIYPEKRRTKGRRSGWRVLLPNKFVRGSRSLVPNSRWSSPGQTYARYRRPSRLIVFGIDCFQIVYKNIYCFQNLVIWFTILIVCFQKLIDCFQTTPD